VIWLLTSDILATVYHFLDLGISFALLVFVLLLLLSHILAFTSPVVLLELGGELAVNDFALHHKAEDRL
jgi:hypothetical protein